MDWLKKTNNDLKWHEWRGKGIGSSDIPVILGVSPWKSYYQLWIEKTDQDTSVKKDNWAMARGRELEPQIRDWYNKTQNCMMVVENVTSTENERWRCSLDGIDRKINKLIEIKAPNKDDHELARSGELPKKYWPQVQWQLLVTGLPSADYVSYNEDYVVINVIADQDYHTMLIEKATEFWQFVETNTSPPTDKEEINDKELELILDRYQETKKAISALEVTLEDYASKIKDKVKSEKATCGRFSLSWISKKGSIDYSSIPQLENVNLEAYRKSGTRYFKITEKTT